MVGGEHQKIAIAQPRHGFGQPAVERLEGGGIAGNVAPVAEKHVEIDEIGEHQVAVLGVVHRAERCVEQRHVAGRLAHFRDALLSEDVADLADPDDLAAARDQPVEQRRLRRRHREIAPVGRPLEASGPSRR